MRKRSNRLGAAERDITGQSRSPKLTKHTLFGSELYNLTDKNDEVPFFFLCAIEFLRESVSQREARTRELFLLPPERWPLGEVPLDDLVEGICKSGPAKAILHNSPLASPHTVAELILTFFRRLPDPPIRAKAVGPLVKVSGVRDDILRTLMCRSLLHSLRPPERNLLHALLPFLHYITRGVFMEDEQYYDDTQKLNCNHQHDEDDDDDDDRSTLAESHGGAPSTDSNASFKRDDDPINPRMKPPPPPRNDDDDEDEDDELPDDGVESVQMRMMTGDVEEEEDEVKPLGGAPDDADDASASRSYSSTQRPSRSRPLRPPPSPLALASLTMVERDRYRNRLLARLIPCLFAPIAELELTASVEAEAAEKSVSLAAMQHERHMSRLEAILGHFVQANTMLTDPHFDPLLRFREQDQRVEYASTGWLLLMLLDVYYTDPDFIYKALIALVSSGTKYHTIFAHLLSLWNRYCVGKPMKDRVGDALHHTRGGGSGIDSGGDGVSASPASVVPGDEIDESGHPMHQQHHREDDVEGDVVEIEHLLPARRAGPNDVSMLVGESNGEKIAKTKSDTIVKGSSGVKRGKNNKGSQKKKKKKKAEKKKRLHSKSSRETRRASKSARSGSFPSSSSSSLTMESAYWQRRLQFRMLQVFHVFLTQMYAPFGEEEGRGGMDGMQQLLAACKWVKRARTGIGARDDGGASGGAADDDGDDRGGERGPPGRHRKPDAMGFHSMMATRMVLDDSVLDDRIAEMADAIVWRIRRDNAAAARRRLEQRCDDVDGGAHRRDGGGPRGSSSAVKRTTKDPLSKSAAAKHGISASRSKVARPRGMSREAKELQRTFAVHSMELSLDIALSLETAVNPSGKADHAQLERVALAMAVCDHRLFTAIPLFELLKGNWQDHEKSPAYTAMVRVGNTWRDWVATTCVCPKSATKRAAALSFWIHLCEILVEQNAFNALFTVLAGLNHSAVSRLKLSWRKVPKKVANVYQTVSLVTDESHNFRGYRERLQHASPPMVPCMALVAKDIFALEETLEILVDIRRPEDGSKGGDGARPDAPQPRVETTSNRLGDDDDEEEEEEGEEEELVVNFAKVEMLWKIIGKLHAAQKGTYACADDPLLALEPLCQQIRVGPSELAKEEDELYQISLLREPRVGGGSSSTSSKMKTLSKVKKYR